MATRNTNFQRPKSISPALSGFAILSLGVSALDAAAAQLSHVLFALTGELFKVLPSVMLAGLQAFETFVLDYAQFLAMCHALVCAWPLLHFVFRAA
jgi:hypothetical protein